MRSGTARKAHIAWACFFNTISSNENIAMKQPIERSTATETFDPLTGTLKVPAEEMPDRKPLPVPLAAAATIKTTPIQIALIGLGTITFLYFARPLVLPSPIKAIWIG